MGVFRQLGDPVAAAAGLCQHHEAAYAELTPTDTLAPVDAKWDQLDNGATIVQVQIVTTETCCIVVNAATMCADPWIPGDAEIERPFGTIRTTQEDIIISDALYLMHHAAWEVLPAGTYTYHLVNRSGFAAWIMGAWIKAVASDCLG